MNQLYALIEEKSKKEILNETDREEIQNMLLNISNEDALILYELFCTASLLSFDDTMNLATEYNVPFEKWTNDANLNNFVNSFVNVGPLLDRIADCIEYSPAEREVLWNRHKEKWKSIHETQLVHKKSQEQISAFNIQSRSLNKKAYDCLYKSLNDCKKSTDAEWQQVIKMDNVALAAKPPLFWCHIRLNKLNALQLRALLHKLTICQEECCLPQHGLDLKERLYQQVMTRGYQKKKVFRCFCQ